MLSLWFVRLPDMHDEIGVYGTPISSEGSESQDASCVTQLR